MNILLSMVFALSAVSPGQQKVHFTVSKDIAIINIPIVHKNEFIWNADKTPDSTLEYACMVKLGNYEFGFSQFKGGDKEERGTMQELLKKGQVDLWKLENGGGEVLEKYRVSVSYNQPHIVIQIKDKDALKLLFAKKPKNYSLEVFGFKNKGNIKKLAIEYKD